MRSYPSRARKRQYSKQTHRVEGRDALEGQGPRRRPQKRVDRRLEEVAKAAGGGYCRLQMPLNLALGVREAVAGYTLGALDRGRGGWHKASVPDCLPIGLSPLLILTLCGPERVLVVSTEPLDDLSCLTTLGVGCPGDGLLPVPLTRCIQMHTPSPCRLPH